MIKMHCKVPDGPSNIVFYCDGCGIKVSMPYIHKEDYTKQTNKQIYGLCAKCMFEVNRSVDVAVERLKSRSGLK